jgi:hypothetical protein
MAKGPEPRESMLVAALSLAVDVTYVCRRYEDSGREFIVAETAFLPAGRCQKRTIEWRVLKQFPLAGRESGGLY